MTNAEWWAEQSAREAWRRDLTAHQIGATLMWSCGRRKRYPRTAEGCAGFSAVAMKAMREQGRARVQARGNQHTFQETCKRGHSLADAYTYTRPGGIRQRQCRTCVKQRDAARRMHRDHGSIHVPAITIPGGPRALKAVFSKTGMSPIATSVEMGSCQK